MATRTTLVVAALAASTFGCHVVVADIGCGHTAPREATLDAAGATRLVIDAGAGSLDVHGVSGAAEVRASGTACASRESILDQVRLVAERRGDALYLEARFPERFSGNAALDFEVEVPAGLAVEIEDGSGPITVRGVASLSLRDGSGEIEVSDVRGAVTIEDGSGEIELLGIGGAVAIEDGSGAIDLRGIGGRITIEDGSGEITIRDADGDVIVDEDGSGSIEVTGVGGSVLVREDGSGSIRVEDVRGDFTVERDGSGGISSADVGGRVSIPD